MKYLKLFESFRQPKEITVDDVKKKKEFYGKEDFTASENQFFSDLLSDLENKKVINTLNFNSNKVYLSVLSLNSDIPQDILIEKLGDNWFVITEISTLYDDDDLPQDPTYKYFEIDEWEEVKGYLSRNTLLKFD